MKLIKLGAIDSTNENFCRNLKLSRLKKQRGKMGSWEAEEG
jgi:hypothetical protein